MALIKNATLMTEFRLDTKHLRTGMKKVSRGVKKLKNNFKKALKGVGIAVAAVTAGFTLLTVAVNKVSGEIDKLAKTSSKLGIIPQELQFLQFQAQLAGVGVDKLNMGLQRMIRRVAEAASGTGEAKKALKELGLSAKDLVKKSPEKTLEAIGKAMGNIKTQSDKVRIGFKIFDAEGVDIINMFGGEVKELKEEFLSLGVALSKDQVKAIEKYNDSWTKLSLLFSGFKKQLISELAKAFELVANRVTSLIKESGGLQKIAQSVAKIIISGMQNAVKGVTLAVNAFKSLNVIMLETLQIADKSSAVFGAFVGAIAQKVGADGVDQTILSQFQRIGKREARLQQLRKELKSSLIDESPLIQKLEKVKQSVGQTAVPVANNTSPKITIGVNADKDKFVDVVVTSDKLTTKINNETFQILESTAQTVN